MTATRPNDPPNGEPPSLTPPMATNELAEPRSSNGKHHTPLRADSCAIDTTRHLSINKNKRSDCRTNTAPTQREYNNNARGHPIFGQFSANSGPGGEIIKMAISAGIVMGPT
ncbi:hypothetical protein BS47DRAFT_1358169 [Hydnum rufescens UP504]|uniref:Uncharacterized protein n=1 Tax=Hydnum rufescens UP504 TaxID=1448309 RepID=A0A9P6B8V1_9AGAM|nr:hypothetical protein BS47DRAFT_1358169 [Hydnum rufescens UP504]